MLGPHFTGDLAQLPVDQGLCGSAGESSAAQGTHKHIQGSTSSFGGPGQQICHTGLPLDHDLQLQTKIYSQLSS